MKIIRLTSLLPDIPRLSLLKPRLRHGRRHSHHSLLNLCLFSVLSLAFLPHLLPPLTSSTVPLPGSRLWSSPTTWDSTFLFSSQRLPFQAPPSHVPRGVSFFHRFPFFPTEFLAAATDLFSFTTTDLGKVVYYILMHLPRCGMDFLLHIFNLSWSLHSFPSIWKTSIIPIHKMGKPLDSPASFRPISFTFCVLELFECIILSRIFSFLKSNSVFSPCWADFRPDGLPLIKFCSFLSSFRLGLINLGRALARV